MWTRVKDDPTTSLTDQGVEVSVEQFSAKTGSFNEETIPLASERVKNTNYIDVLMQPTLTHLNEI